MSFTNSKRKSPCVGICSTTYGDLVCRGCRRFAHEIVGWNGYAEQQKNAIVDRLNKIKTSVISQYIFISNSFEYSSCCKELGFNADRSEDEIYVVLSYLVAKSQKFEVAGISFCDDQVKFSATSDLMRFLESEMYLRAQAQYERNFKIRV